jgi:hypothetical protein
MDNQNNVLDENLNTSEEEVIDLDLDTEQEDNTEEEVDVAQLLAEKKKAEELAHNYKIRAEKAEKEAKTKASKPAQDSSLSVHDAIALMTAKVTEAEDIKEVEDYARYRGISVSEALKSSVVKTLLSEREETRKTAQATNTGKARAGSTKLSDDVILQNASQGKLPDDPAALVAARFNRR